MMSIIRVSPKGQLVIPANLRKKYGIQTPGRAIIAEREGHIVITPAPADPVGEARGMLRGKQSLTKTHINYKQAECDLEQTHERQLP